MELRREKMAKIIYLGRSRRGREVFRHAPKKETVSGAKVFYLRWTRKKAMPPYSSPISETQVTVMSVYPLRWTWLPDDTGPCSLWDHTSVWL